MTEEDKFQNKAEEARKQAGKAIDHKLKEANLLHDLASNMINTFQDPAKKYENTSDLLKEKVVETKKRNQVVRSANDTKKSGEEHPFVVNGYKLPMSGAPLINAVTLLMFIFATELSKDPKINEILKQAHFNFKDLEGKQIYPKNVKKSKKKRKAKKKNVRSRKRKLH